MKNLSKVLSLIIIFTVVFPMNLAHALEPATSDIIRKAEEKAYQQRLQAQNKARAIDNHYNDGISSYKRKDFSNAISNFEEVLKVAPDYEPAKLYLECAIMEQKLSSQEELINSIKLQMADITAEYDRKIKEVKGLAFTYLLEQALLRCQAQDYEGADYYYNLCYKLDPAAKEQISWFVNATYELRDLSKSLDECYREVEEISDLELGAVNSAQ